MNTAFFKRPSWQRGPGNSKRQVVRYAAGKPKPKDHIDKDKTKKKVPEVSVSESKYQDIIESEVREARTSSSPRNNDARNMARAEAIMATGMGGLVGHQALLELLSEEKQTKVTPNHKISGSSTLDSLSASLADKGYDLDGDFGSVTISKATTAQIKQASSSISSIELLKPPSNAKFAVERRESEGLQNKKRKPLFLRDESYESDDETLRMEEAANYLFSLPKPPPSVPLSTAAQPSKKDDLKGLDTYLAEVLRASREEEEASRKMRGPDNKKPLSQSPLTAATREKEEEVDGLSLEAAQLGFLSSLPSESQLQLQRAKAKESLGQTQTQLEKAAIYFAKREAEEAEADAEMREMLMKARRGTQSAGSLLRPSRAPERSSLSPSKGQRPLDRDNLNSLLDSLGSPSARRESSSAAEEDPLAIAARGWKVAKEASKDQDSLTRPQLQRSNPQSRSPTRRNKTSSGGNNWINQTLSDQHKDEARRRALLVDDDDIFIPPPRNSTPKLQKPPSKRPSTN